MHNKESNVFGETCIVVLSPSTIGCFRARLFYYLEQNDFLSPISSTDLFALHYIFLPRINQSLEEFVGAWNNYAIRTEDRQTPNQLFTAGSLQLHNSRLTALDFLMMLQINMEQMMNHLTHHTLMNKMMKV